MNDLQIPIGNSLAHIPFPMSDEDFSLLIETLNLWKQRLVGPATTDAADKVALDRWKVDAVLTASNLEPAPPIQTSCGQTFCLIDL